MKRALFIPDVQAGPGRPNRHLTWVGRYAADKGFDPIIQAGDWGDYPSLSFFDKGKLVFEGRRLSKDWDAHRTSVDLFETELAKAKGYKPRKVYTKGNHEFRIERAMNDSPGLDTLPNVTGYMQERGWETYEYLQVAKVEGVLFSHLFPRTLTGRVTNSSIKYGANSANHMVRANMASCVAGHKPGFDYAAVPGPGERKLHGLIAGSFYLHKETYAGPNSDINWKGVVVLNRLKAGSFDVCAVSIDYLRERYG